MTTKNNKTELRGASKKMFERLMAIQPSLAILKVAMPPQKEESIPKEENPDDQNKTE